MVFGRHEGRAPSDPPHNDAERGEWQRVRGFRSLCRLLATRLAFDISDCDAVVVNLHHPSAHCQN